MNKDAIKRIYNDGERMVPFVTHDDKELIRHFSSHSFFREIILKDISKQKDKDLSVLDIGFGTGYACYLYSKVDKIKRIKGIDISEDSLEWATKNFNNKKIDYEICDAEEFLKRTESYSYIVSRHVLEHIKNGLNLIEEDKFEKRLCINVPYDEKKGNEFHLLTCIKESDFPVYSNVEFFYEDLDGITYDKIPKGIFINSIVCIASKKGMAKVSDYFTFPRKASTIDEIKEELGGNNSQMLTNVIEINKEINAEINTELQNKNKKLENLSSIMSLEISKLNDQLDDILNSKSWKMIEFIRKLKAYLLHLKSLK